MATQRRELTKLPPVSVQNATLAVRLITYLAALGMFGTMFLPWITLDGHESPASGAELATIFIDPGFTYLNAVSQSQALFLVAGPAVIFIATIAVAVRKHARQASPVAPVVVILVAVAMGYVPADLIDPTAERFAVGIFAVVAISAVLLAQDLLAIIRTRFRVVDRAPKVDQVLGIVSGSGNYRWVW